MFGSLWEDVCVGVAEVSSSEDAELTAKVVGISFPKNPPPNPDDFNDPENYHDFFVSVAAAKALLVDLKDAIDSIVEKKPFDD